MEVDDLFKILDESGYEYEERHGNLIEIAVFINGGSLELEVIY